MSHRFRKIALLAALPLALACTAAGAQSYGDPASNLSVSPPKPFFGKAGRPHPLFDVTIDIDSTTGTPKAVNAEGHVCTLGFKPAAQNAQLNREIINAQMARPEWQKLYRDMFETIGTVSDLKLFEHQGFSGIELVVTPKAGPNAGNVRMFTSTLETPKGRTALICATEATGLAASITQFKALRETIHAPE